MMITEEVAQLVAEFAATHRTTTGSHERALVEHVLTQLGDPESDCDELLAELCGRRWAAYADGVAS